MTTLRGITWAHARGTAPLVAATQAMKATEPELDITWDARPLSAYEDRPIAEMASDYDIIVINHPFIGDSAHDSLLLPLEDWLPEEHLADQAANSVGDSFASYRYDGRQYALAVDAASIVSAYRPDTFQVAGLAPPRTVEEIEHVFTTLADKRLPPPAIPLGEQHAFSAFVSLAANVCENEFWTTAGIDHTAGMRALSCLRRLAAAVDVSCLSMNPINVLDAMSRGLVSYVPFIYGYVNYVKATDNRHAVAFADMPSLTGQPTGSLLGGVGIGVSAHSAQKKMATRFVQFVTEPEVQRGVYAGNEGQPAHRAAWLDPVVHRQWPHFYDSTIETLDHSYLRPRLPGFPAFQRKARSVIHEFLRDGGSESEALQRVNELYRPLAESMGDGVSWRH